MTYQIVKQMRPATTPPIISVSLYFFFWIPSIRRPIPGTLLVIFPNPPLAFDKEFLWLRREPFVSKAWLHREIRLWVKWTKNTIRWLDGYLSTSLILRIEAAMLIFSFNSLDIDESFSSCKNLRLLFSNSTLSRFLCIDAWEILERQFLDIVRLPFILTAVFLNSVL